MDVGLPEREDLADAPGAGVTLVVCTSCRDVAADPALGPTAGSVLAARTREAAAGSIPVRTVECLGNCKRRLSAAILRDTGWSYVFGDLTVDSAADLVAGAKLYAGVEDDVMPWRGRPDALKRGLVARLPPKNLLRNIP